VAISLKNSLNQLRGRKPKLLAQHTILVPLKERLPRVQAPRYRLTCEVCCAAANVRE